MSPSTPFWDERVLSSRQRGRQAYPPSCCSEPFQMGLKYLGSPGLYIISPWCGTQGSSLSMASISKQGMARLQVRHDVFHVHRPMGAQAARLRLLRSAVHRPSSSFRQLQICAGASAIWAATSSSGLAGLNRQACPPSNSDCLLPCILRSWPAGVQFEPQ